MTCYLFAVGDDLAPTRSWCSVYILGLLGCFSVAIASVRLYPRFVLYPRLRFGRSFLEKAPCALEQQCLPLLIQRHQGTSPITTGGAYTVGRKLQLRSDWALSSPGKCSRRSFRGWEPRIGAEMCC